MKTAIQFICLVCVVSVFSVAWAVDARAAPPPTTKPASMGDPTVPAVKTGTNGPKFLQMHEDFLKQAKAGNIDLLFLGDSITANWTKAPDIWKERYSPLHAANFGIGGDRTQHVLWRITNGELDDIHPKVVVLMIGTNNTNSDPPGPIADAVKKIIDITREKTGAKILLLAVFPRERKQDTANQMETIHAINEKIKTFDDGKNVRYLDIGPKFMGPDGHLNQDLFSDGLHPNVQGYQIWAESIQGLLDEMMKS